MASTPASSAPGLSARRLFSVEGGSYRRLFGRWWPDGIHVWAGPIGLHLFWPDLWKSRLDYCAPSRFVPDEWPFPDEDPPDPL